MSQYRLNVVHWFRNPQKSNARSADIISVFASLPKMKCLNIKARHSSPVH